MLESFAQTLSNPGMVDFVNGSRWVWPICEIFHFVGMALLIGTVGLIDLRILGVAKGLSLEKLEKLVPIGLLGFSFNVVSGFMFVTGGDLNSPQAYMNNLAFMLKMLAILIAGLNLAVYYFAGIAPQVRTTGPQQDAPMPAKVVAVVSLLMWFSVIFMGRLIMYNETLLYSLGL